jgi:hypothetical protein
MAFWYPFRSREVRDIISHLTPEEFVSLGVIAKREGEKIGREVVAPGSMISGVVVVECIRGLHVIPAMLLIAVVFGIYFVICWKVTRSHRARMRSLLCSTDYARRVGYRADFLPMYGLDFMGLLRA